MRKIKKNKAEIAGIVTGVIFVVLIALSLALTPLWVWIDNGKSIYGGINDTALSFGLAFIGTASVTGVPIKILGGK